MQKPGTLGFGKGHIETKLFGGKSVEEFLESIYFRSRRNAEIDRCSFSHIKWDRFCLSSQSVVANLVCFHRASRIWPLVFHFVFAAVLQFLATLTSILNSNNAVQNLYDSALIQTYFVRQSFAGLTLKFSLYFAFEIENDPGKSDE